jgi:phosphate transport system protein
MMRFREIYELWRRDNSLNLALARSLEMLEKTHSMFQESVKALRYGGSAGTGSNVYEEDRTINAYQMDVRRKILRYLAVTGTMDLIPGLVLINIVVDIERIGDYTKNITELAAVHPGNLHCGGFEDRVRAIEQTVEKLFAEVPTILKSSNQQVARALSNECYQLRANADRIISELIRQEDESLGRGQAAAIALYVRYLKRVGAHLLNILSSVVNPFERIGFRETDRPD